MNLYLDEFANGAKETIELYKQGNNIFEMKGGNMFPTNSSQRLWHYSKGDDHIHFSDGTHTYSFKGKLDEVDTDLEKIPDVPFPDLFTDSKSRGKAQVHRSDPGSIYFTLQEGRANPTYTFRHMGDSKWKAIPKARKVKAVLKQPVTPPNVNIESVKEGMLKELETFKKEADGGLPGFFSQTIGKGLHSLANLPGRIALAPARIFGGPETFKGDQNPEAAESIGASLGNAGVAGLTGAGLGGLLHIAKRNLYNTEEENQQEDVEGGHLGKDMLMGALPLAGATLAGRQMFPKAVNNPELNLFR